MKLYFKTLIITLLAASAVFCPAFRSNAQTFLVDPTQDWIGYTNIYALTPGGGQGAYVDGGVCPTGALQAHYNSSTNEVILTVCTNSAGEGQYVDAVYYVQINEQNVGQTLTFSGNCISDTFNTNYIEEVFIEEFTSGYALINSTYAPVTNGQPFSIQLTTAGGTYIQYGFQTLGPDATAATAASLGEAIYQVQRPTIEASAITSQAAVEGQSVSFTESPTGDGPFTYQWQLNGVSLVNGSNFSGVTSNVLTISNVTPADAGTLTVNITNSAGSSALANAYFAVDPLATAETNVCLEPCFDSGLFAPDPAVGWYTYGGSTILNTNDPYSDTEPLTGPNISTVEGTNVLEEYSGGANSYTGVFQNRPALPGQVYTASAWFYTEDAVNGNPLVNSASANLQVQFYNSGGGLICDYESTPFTTNFPQDVWIQMPVTNKYAADFVTLLSTGPLIISPPGTASMRIQPGYHAPDAISAGDVFIDLVDVTLHETPATVVLSGSTINLSFPTFYGPIYNVLYTSDLVHGPWHVLTSVAGDGTVKTVADTVGSSERYYIINTRATGLPTD